MSRPLARCRPRAAAAVAGRCLWGSGHCAGRSPGHCRLLASLLGPHRFPASSIRSIMGATEPEPRGPGFTSPGSPMAILLLKTSKLSGGREGEKKEGEEGAAVGLLFESHGGPPPPLTGVRWQWLRSRCVTRFGRLWWLGRPPSRLYG